MREACRSAENSRRGFQTVAAADRARRGRRGEGGLQSCRRPDHPDRAGHPERAYPQQRAEPATRSVMASTRLNERQLETVRVRNHERPVAPRHILRLLIEASAARLDFCGQAIEALGLVAPPSRAEALLAIATLGEIVLTQHERHRTSVDLTSGERSILPPLFPNHEPEHIAVEGDAPLQIRCRERGSDLP